MDDSVCCDCVGEPFLVHEISQDGHSDECVICGEYKKCTSLHDLKQKIECLFDEYIRPGGIIYNYDSDSPQFDHQEGDDLQFWIATVLDTDENEDVVEAVHDQFMKDAGFEFMSQGESRYNCDARYIRSPVLPPIAEVKWTEFTDEIRYSRRFFCEGAKPFLDWLFKDIADYLVPGSANEKAIYSVESVAIFRARIYHSSADFEAISKNPKKELFIAPKEKALAGRMNPSSIAAFYGSFDRETCVAELRPPVGGTVVSGKFNIVRPLRVLDFTKLADIFHPHRLSYFDPSFMENECRIQFLESLHEKISMPILPSQTEDYLTTQVIAEYLSSYLSIEAVLYSSAQIEEGSNIVIFSPATDALAYATNSIVRHKIRKVQYETDSQPYEDGQPENIDFESDNWSF